MVNDALTRWTSGAITATESRPAEQPNTAVHECGSDANGCRPRRGADAACGEWARRRCAVEILERGPARRGDGRACRPVRMLDRAAGAGRRRCADRARPDGRVRLD